MAVVNAFDEMIHLYADGELPFEQQPVLFAHLAASEEARVLLESIMQFRRMSRQETFTVTPAMDASFMQRLAKQRRVMPRVERAPVRSSLWQRRARISLRSAALIAVLILLIGVWTSRPPDPPLETRAQVVLLDESPVVMSAQYVFTPGVVVEAER